MTDPTLARLLADPKYQEAYIALNGAILDFDRRGIDPTTDARLEEALVEAERRYISALLAALPEDPEGAAKAAEWLWDHVREHGDPLWSSLLPRARSIWLEAASELAAILFPALTAQLAAARKAALSWLSGHDLERETELLDTGKRTVADLIYALIIARNDDKEALSRLTAENAALKAELLGNGVADDLHKRYRAALMWLEQNNHSLLVTADGRWWVPDYLPASSPYDAIENARAALT